MEPNATSTGKRVDNGLYVTKDIPGIGGVIKKYCEDFYVEEIPLYEPTGEGRHTYLTIEKTGLSTFQAIQRIGDYFNVPPETIGYAGMKDSRAVTVQRISIEDVDVEEAIDLELPGIRILDAQYHSNKIRMGHLAGNYFVIRVRDVGPNAFEYATKVMERLYEIGVPNFFGMQRFSGRRNGHLIGRAIILERWEEALSLYLGRPQPHEKPPLREARAAFDEGDYTKARRLFPYHRHREERRALAALENGLSPRDAFHEISRRMRQLFTSAYQSALFNRVLAARLDEFGTLMDGDIAMKHQGGGAFHVEDASVEQPRADAFEISPSGPLFGSKMLRPTGVPRKIEDRVLEAEGFNPEALEREFRNLRGARRPLRVPVMDPVVKEEENGDITVSFRLPSGSYATVVMDEIMKTGAMDLLEDEE